MVDFDRFPLDEGLGGRATLYRPLVEASATAGVMQATRPWGPSATFPRWERSCTSVLGAGTQSRPQAPGPTCRSVLSDPLGAGSGRLAPRSGSMRVIRLGHATGVRPQHDGRDVVGTALSASSAATSLGVRAPGLRAPDPGVSPLTARLKVADSRGSGTWGRGAGGLGITAFR